MMNDSRQYVRLSTPKGTILAWQNAGVKKVSGVANLGLGGLYIRTVEPPPAGTYIQLLLDVPAGEVRARAVVQRSQAKKRHGGEDCSDAARRPCAIRRLAEASINPRQSLREKLIATLFFCAVRRLSMSPSARPDAGGKGLDSVEAEVFVELDGGTVIRRYSQR